jgi:biopolymer transport protein ExbD/biopolymer transport protein TolR
MESAGIASDDETEGGSGIRALVPRKRPRPKRVRAPAPHPDINVTPLVDIVLVLLIIFMVVTPALAQGENTVLPEAVKIDKVPKDVDPIKLIMAASGTLLLNGKKTSPAELPERLRAIHAQSPDRQLLLNTDAKVPYVKVRETLALLQNLGFKGVSLKVQPKREGD